MSNVVSFRGVTKLDLDPDTVLENSKGQVDNFIILGYDKEGDFWFSSTMGSGGDVMWLMEVAKIQLLKIAGEIE